MQYAKCLVVLDGPKGVGKSTTTAALRKLVPDMVDISLDFVRRDIGIEGTSFEKNKVAFEEVKVRVEQALAGEHAVILDCGLNDYRIAALNTVARMTHSGIIYFFLKAPYEILVARVAARDKAKARQFNKHRFDEVYELVMDKDFSKFHVIDTSLYTATAVASQIYQYFITSA